MKPEDLQLWKDVMSGAVRIPLARDVVKSKPKIANEIDLHGMTTQAAYGAAMEFISQAVAMQKKSIVIVTGLSGSIRTEFPLWIENLRNIRKITPISGGGAFRVYFYRQPNRGGSNY